MGSPSVPPLPLSSPFPRPPFPPRALKPILWVVSGGQRPHLYVLPQAEWDPFQRCACAERPCCPIRALLNGVGGGSKLLERVIERQTLGGYGASGGFLGTEAPRVLVCRVTYGLQSGAGAGMSSGSNSPPSVFLHLPRDTQSRRLTVHLRSVTWTVIALQAGALCLGPRRVWEDRGWTHTTSSLSHHIPRSLAPSTSQLKKELGFMKYICSNIDSKIFWVTQTFNLYSVKWWLISKYWDHFSIR